MNRAYGRIDTQVSWCCRSCLIQTELDWILADVLELNWIVVDVTDSDWIQTESDCVHVLDELVLNWCVHEIVGSILNHSRSRIVSPTTTISSISAIGVYQTASDCVHVLDELGMNRCACPSELLKVIVLMCWTSWN
jgi:hypothetical protein